MNLQASSSIVVCFLSIGAGPAIFANETVLNVKLKSFAKTLMAMQTAYGHDYPPTRKH